MLHEGLSPLPYETIAIASSKKNVASTFFASHGTLPLASLWRVISYLAITNILRKLGNDPRVLKDPDPKSRTVK